MDKKPGKFSITLRWVCSFLVVEPLLYFALVTDGDAYLFLVMVLLAPLAGTCLIINSLLCIFRIRRRDHILISILFMLLGGSGFLVAGYFLPQFRM